MEEIELILRIESEHQYSDDLVSSINAGHMDNLYLRSMGLQLTIAMDECAKGVLEFEEYVDKGLIFEWELAISCNISLLNQISQVVNNIRIFHTL